MDELTRRALVDKVANVIADYEARELNDTDIEGLNGEELACIMECLQSGQYGWLPCYVRMPEAEDLHEKNIEDCTSYLVERKSGVMEVAHYIKVYGKAYFSAHAMELKDVVAWRPLPESYKPFI